MQEINLNRTIELLQKTIDQNYKQIEQLKNTIQDQKRIIDGLSSEYESRYGMMKAKGIISEAESRIIDFFRTKKGEYIEKDVVDRLIRNRYTYYGEGTIPRACRDLETKGRLLVAYKEGHPYYTLNLKHGET